MNDINCEDILMAKMAELDGEEINYSASLVDAHFLVCQNCRSEFEQIQKIGDLFEKQARREHKVDLWSAIKNRTNAKSISPISLKPFVIISILLFIYKLFDIFSPRDLGWTFQVVPLLFIIALFIFLRENPFKINAGLELER